MVHADALHGYDNSAHADLMVRMRHVHHYLERHGRIQPRLARAHSEISARLGQDGFLIEGGAIPTGADLRDAESMLREAFDATAARDSWCLDYLRIVHGLGWPTPALEGRAADQAKALTTLIDRAPKVTGFGSTRAGKRFRDLIGHLRAMDRPLTIVSAASHIGAEPYTLAMFLEVAGLSDVRVIAHDGDAAHHYAAREGRYLASEISIDFRLGHLPPGFRDFFEHAGDGVVRLSSRIRERVEWSPRPLLLPDEGLRPADVYMIRNAWVHLSPGNRVRLARSLAQLLPADGLVFTRNTHVEEMQVAFARIGRDQHIWRCPQSASVDGLDQKRMKAAHDEIIGLGEAGTPESS